MLSGEGELGERHKAVFAAAMQTASPSGRDSLEASGAASRSTGELQEIDSSVSRPAKVAFSPFEQSNSSKEVHAPG